MTSIPSNLSNEIGDLLDKFIVNPKLKYQLTTLFNKQIVAELKGVLHTPKNSGKEEYILKRIKELERGAE